jgi:hypothetical protein
MLHFPGMLYAYAFYPFPLLYVQTDLRLADCCQYFQLGIRKKKYFQLEFLLCNILLSPRCTTNTGITKVCY